MRGIELMNSLMASAEGQKQILDWTKQPLTIAMVDAICDHLGAANISPILSDAAGNRELGRVAGVQSVALLMRDPQKFLVVPGTDDELARRREVLQNPMYGSESVLSRTELGLI